MAALLTANDMVECITVVLCPRTAHGYRSRSNAASHSSRHALERVRHAVSSCASLTAPLPNDQGRA